MKRDLDRIRSILLRCEGARSSRHLLLDFSEKDRYQIKLMAVAGLVELDNPADEPYKFREDFVDHLALPHRPATFAVTWEGHDYLEVVRDEGVWRQTSSALDKIGGSATLGIVRNLADGFLTRKLSRITGLEIRS